MLTVVYNLMYFALLVFAAALIILGLFGQLGAVSILRNQNTVNAVLMGVGGTILIGALVIFAALDVIKGPTDSVLITSVGSWVSQILSTSFSPFQP
jgi:hypothetical protein